MSNRESYVNYLLKLLLHEIGVNIHQGVDIWKCYISFKSKNSANHIIEKININANVLSDFEIK